MYNTSNFPSIGAWSCPAYHTHRQRQPVADDNIPVAFPSPCTINQIAASSVDYVSLVRVSWLMMVPVAQNWDNQSDGSSVDYVGETLLVRVWICMCWRHDLHAPVTLGGYSRLWDAILNSSVFARYHIVFTRYRKLTLAIRLPFDMDIVGQEEWGRVLQWFLNTNNTVYTVYMYII